MRKLTFVLCISTALLLNTSCATILEGQRTEYQKTKPKKGEPKRQIRLGYFWLELLFCEPCLLIDWATGAIYMTEGEIKLKEEREKK